MSIFSGFCGRYDDARHTQGDPCSLHCRADLLVARLSGGRPHVLCAVCSTATEILLIP